VRASRREDGMRVQQGIRVDVDAGTAQVLTALGDDVFDVRDSDDGRALIVGEVVDNAARLLRTTAVGAPLERLPPSLVANYQVAGTASRSRSRS
jgi:hypothetical protein